MKFTHTICIALGVLVFIIGCGKSDDTSVTPPPPPPKQPEAAVATPSATPPPAPVTPPPVAGTGPAAPAAPETEPKEIKDPDGKTISAIAYLQSLVDGYNRTRSSQVEGNPWPPLTDLQQLVNVGYAKRLPSAPAGQKFVFDSKTGKVTLAPN